MARATLCSSWILALALTIACGPTEPPATASAAAPSRTPATYAIDDFYRNTQFRGASWSPQRDKILVSSDASGIWNAYAIPATGGAPAALTTSTTDSIFALSYFPADERFLYSSDQGGNELTHIFVRNPDGSTRDLTPGTKLKANFHGWAGDDKSLLVSTNERDARYFDLYEIAVDGYARTMLYKNTDGYDIGAISRDTRFIALVKSKTTSDSDIFLHDRTRGTTKNITTHTGAVSNAPTDFSPDNTRLLFTSDADREFAALRSCDTATGVTSPFYQDEWDIVAADYSKGGRYLTVYVNEDSRFAARVLDAATLKPAVINGMPQGLVRGVSISRDDSALAFYASDGSVPNDLYAGTFVEMPRRLTDALNPKIHREDLVVPELVRFQAKDGVTVPGLLYRPHQASTDKKAPALVLVHGGPGGQAQVGYFALTQALVNHGYAVYDINNRGSSGYGKTFFAMDDRKHGEADLADVVASKGMLVATGYVDPARIGIIGGSYGGYMVLAALTLQPDAFKVGVDLFGISNWSRTLSSIPAWWGSVRDALYAELGDPKTDVDRLRRISPLVHADRIKVPLMVLQGANDPRVLQVESDEIVAAAKKNGVPVEYIVFPDEGHGFVKKDNEIKGYGGVIAFLDKYLKSADAGTSTE
ncbi:MAG TPA: prolyl oligopeptidase family serine peptidase [Vicinamibacterales bacterium]|nr:prolyl oligopeptidase family serine peptidase [Vicinamibacterales bacterium]